MASEPRSHRIGLVLGGGGARGLCHIGVWRVLGELGIRPDALAGTSMGGLVAAFIAAGHDADSLERVASELSWPKMIEWSISGRVVSATRFRDWLAQHLPETFEQLDLPLVLTATDLVEGQTHYLHRGDLHEALQATVAYPGALDGVRVGDALLVDGGVLNQIPDYRTIMAKMLTTIATIRTVRSSTFMTVSVRAGN